jgi:hypothetical protein
MTSPVSFNLKKLDFEMSYLGMRDMFKGYNF